MCGGKFSEALIQNLVINGVNFLSSSLSIIKLKFVILIGAQRSEESPFER